MNVVISFISKLAKTCRDKDAASDFFGEENVPRKAITMGVGSIMKARKCFMMAWGEGKAGVIKKAVEGPVTDQIPSSFLQKHPDCLVILDEAASSEYPAPPGRVLFEDEMPLIPAHDNERSIHRRELIRQLLSR